MKHAPLLVVFAISVLTNADQISEFEGNSNIKCNLNHIYQDLSVVETIKNHGYPVEEHRLQTDDKYFITLFHISKGIRNKCDNREPVLLMHGIYDSAEAWIRQGPEKSLAYLLAEECFDVWLGNARGSLLSRRDTKITRDFWNFSFHEIGNFDLPRMIDFILLNTRRDKLHYIGFSQGTTAIFALTATWSEYNQKLITLTALAPVAYMLNVTNPVIKAVAEFAKNQDALEDFFKNGEFVSGFVDLANIVVNVCNKYKSNFSICNDASLQSFGVNAEMKNQISKLPCPSDTPGGGSLKEMLHHAQNFNSGSFRRFDHGPEENIRLYDSTEPPNYDLKKIVAPTILIYGDADVIAEETSVVKLASEISNPNVLLQVPHKHFGHLDFLNNPRAKQILYDSIITRLKSYSP